MAINKMRKLIFKILLALTEKWIRENNQIVKYHLEQQMIYGKYPENTIIAQSLNFRIAWNNFLISVCKEMR